LDCPHMTLVEEYNARKGTEQHNKIVPRTTFRHDATRPVV